MKKRILYLIAFIILVGIEVLIGKFAHGFVRGYVGDMLVVMVIYTFIRIIIPEKFPWLSAAVFLFAVFVEIMQGINIVDKLNITNENVRIAIGTKFDLSDILCYAVGFMVTEVYEILIRKFAKRREGK